MHAVFSRHWIGFGLRISALPTAQPIWNCPRCSGNSVLPLALADEVTVQPGGRMRVVISLGPVESLNLPARLTEAMP